MTKKPSRLRIYRVFQIDVYTISVSTYFHRMIIALPPCLFIMPWIGERVYRFSTAFWIINHKNCISVLFHCWEIVFQRMYTSIWDTLYIKSTRYFFQPRSFLLPLFGFRRTSKYILFKLICYKRLYWRLSHYYMDTVYSVSPTFYLNCILLALYEQRSSEV